MSHPIFFLLKNHENLVTTQFSFTKKNSSFFFVMGIQENQMLLKKSKFCFCPWHSSKSSGCLIFLFLKEHENWVATQFSSTKKIQILFLAWALRIIKWPLGFPFLRRRFLSFIRTKHNQLFDYSFIEEGRTG